jgi:hypothetical protein
MNTHVWTVHAGRRDCSNGIETKLWAGRPRLSLFSIMSKLVLGIPILLYVEKRRLFLQR